MFPPSGPPFRAPSAAAGDFDLESPRRDTDTGEFTTTHIGSYPPSQNGHQYSNPVYSGGQQGIRPSRLPTPPPNFSSGGDLEGSGPGFSRSSGIPQPRLMGGFSVPSVTRTATWPQNVPATGSVSRGASNAPTPTVLSPMQKNLVEEDHSAVIQVSQPTVGLPYAPLRTGSGSPHKMQALQQYARTFQPDIPLTAEEPAEQWGAPPTQGYDQPPVQNYDAFSAENNGYYGASAVAYPPQQAQHDHYDMPPAWETEGPQKKVLPPPAAHIKSPIKARYAKGLDSNASNGTNATHQQPAPPTANFSDGPSFPSSGAVYPPASTGASGLGLPESGFNSDTGQLPEPQQVEGGWGAPPVVSAAQTAPPMGPPPPPMGPQSGGFPTFNKPLVTRTDSGASNQPVGSAKSGGSGNKVAPPPFGAPFGAPPTGGFGGGGGGGPLKMGSGTFVPGAPSRGSGDALGGSGVFKPAPPAAPESPSKAAQSQATNVAQHQQRTKQKGRKKSRRSGGMCRKLFLLTLALILSVFISTSTTVVGVTLAANLIHAAVSGVTSIAHGGSLAAAIHGLHPAAHDVAQHVDTVSQAQWLATEKTLSCDDSKFPCKASKWALHSSRTGGILVKDAALTAVARAPDAWNHAGLPAIEFCKQQGTLLFHQVKGLATPEGRAEVRASLHRSVGEVQQLAKDLYEWGHCFTLHLTQSGTHSISHWVQPAGGCWREAMARYLDGSSVAAAAVEGPGSKSPNDTPPGQQEEAPWTGLLEEELEEDEDQIQEKPADMSSHFEESTRNSTDPGMVPQEPLDSVNNSTENDDKSAQGQAADDQMFMGGEYYGDEEEAAFLASLKEGGGQGGDGGDSWPSSWEENKEEEVLSAGDDATGEVSEEQGGEQHVPTEGLSEDEPQAPVDEEGSPVASDYTDAAADGNGVSTEENANAPLADQYYYDTQEREEQTQEQAPLPDEVVGDVGPWSSDQRKETADELLEADSPADAAAYQPEDEGYGLYADQEYAQQEGYGEDGGYAPEDGYYSAGEGEGWEEGDQQQEEGGVTGDGEGVDELKSGAGAEQEEEGQRQEEVAEENEEQQEEPAAIDVDNESPLDTVESSEESETAEEVPEAAVVGDIAGAVEEETEVVSQEEKQQQQRLPEEEEGEQARRDMIAESVLGSEGPFPRDPVADVMTDAISTHEVQGTGTATLDEQEHEKTNKEQEEETSGVNGSEEGTDESSVVEISTGIKQEADDSKVVQERDMIADAILAAEAPVERKEHTPQPSSPPTEPAWARLLAGVATLKSKAAAVSADVLNVAAGYGDVARTLLESNQSAILVAFVVVGATSGSFLLGTAVAARKAAAAAAEDAGPPLDREVEPAESTVWMSARSLWVRGESSEEEESVEKPKRQRRGPRKSAPARLAPLAEIEEEEEEEEEEGPSRGRRSTRGATKSPTKSRAGTSKTRKQSVSRRSRATAARDSDMD